ncbi:alpha/beta fold hydrolase [Yunchengibacter salinarum]|uniref:alpha/beta fold hydrolase n=1 Tax=Yunchengibacter salinarum TaxID=3133399 RepID=UPI0035B5B120
MSDPSYLETGHGTRIAYHRTPGAGPGIVWCGGFMSDMNGGKATRLESYARAAGRAFVRFDYQGHGASSGAFADGTIGLWAKDAIAVIDRLTQGPQILVGSSMGGWIALLAALARPGRVKGMVGIAAAPDFTDRLWHDELNEADRAAIRRDGYVDRPSDYGPDPYRLTRALFEDGWRNRVAAGPIPLDIPFRLIQGTADPDVPWPLVMDWSGKLKSDDVDVILVPGGDHRLSRPQDLDRLVRVVDALARQVGANGDPAALGADAAGADL